MKMDLWIRVENEYCSSIQRVEGVIAVFDIGFLDKEECRLLNYQYSKGMCGIFGECNGEKILLGLYDKDRCNSIIEEIHKRLYSEKDIVIFTMPTINYKGESENEE